MAVLTYKCINCDGPVSFNAKKGKYVCDYCGSAFTEEDFKNFNPASAQESYEEGPASGDVGASDGVTGAAGSDASGAAGYGTSAAAGAASGAASGTSASSGSASQPAKMKTAVYNCPSCGAQIMTDGTTAASICYFCHNPVVLSDRLTGTDAPEIVVPFEIDNKKAKEIFKEWIGQHKYVPKSFYNASQVELLSGVYFPYWIYNCEVDGKVAGRGNKERTWDEAGMRHTETTVYSIAKEGSMDINNVTRIALNKASKVLVESVMPFDINKAKPFGMGYLQGYVAEIKDIEKSSMEQEVTDEVKSYAKSQLEASASEGYNSTQFETSDVKIRNASWKYALMPVYTLTYHDRGSNKLYYFSINGQTGKTCGELPTDDSAIKALFFKIFIPVFIVLMLILFFFM